MLNDDARVVDLTQPLGPNATVWPGGAALGIERTTSLAEGSTYSRRFSLEEHCGTHLDAPGHVREGGLLVDRIPVRALIGRAYVLDLVAACGDDAGFTVERRHVELFESRHGFISPGSIVLARTGWDRFLGTPVYLGERGTSFPGYGEGAAAELIERGIVGLGIDSAGVDPGCALGLPVHRLTAKSEIYHLEGLVGLGELPPTGAAVFVGAPPLVDHSGVPVRALALVPTAGGTA